MGKSFPLVNGCLINMRVRRLPHIPSVVSLEAILELEEFFNLSAPEIQEDPNMVVATELFALAKPGSERICLVLRADGLTYKSISDITGLTEGQIKNIIYTIRRRIVEKIPTKDILKRFRLQQEANGQAKPDPFVL